MPGEVWAPTSNTNAGNSGYADCNAGVVYDSKTSTRCFARFEVSHISTRFSTRSSLDRTRQTCAISGVASFPEVATLGVGEADTTANALTNCAIERPRRTTDLTFRSLPHIGFEPEYCLFMLSDIVLLVVVRS